MAPESASWSWAHLRSVGFREAHRLLGDPHDAEDAAQEAAIRAWRQQRACRRRDDPQPWMRQIARREALRLVARRHEASALDEDAPVLAAGAGAEAVHTRVDVGRALNALSAGDRNVLLARYGLDMTQSAVAAALGIPEGTAKVRLHRARSKLRSELAED